MKKDFLVSSNQIQLLPFNEKRFDSLIAGYPVATSFNDNRFSNEMKDHHGGYLR